jgi:hypothetical protein
VIRALQSEVRFGVAFYGVGSSPGGDTTCPYLHTVPCALYNLTTIEGAYPMGPWGGTPTGPAINQVLDMIDTLRPVSTVPTYFLLATDGEPHQCEDTMETDCPECRAESVAALERAFDMGIRTYVLSVGSDTRDAHLQDLANAGMGLGSAPAVPAPKWTALDNDGLVDAIEQIVGRAASCQIELDGMITDITQACGGTVELGGRPLQCHADPTGAASGWHPIDPTHIELLGTDCAQLQQDDTTLTAWFPCGLAVPF